MDETKKEAPKEAPKEATKQGELPEKDLSKVVGGVGFGDIKGESTDKDHKDWISITD